MVGRSCSDRKPSHRETATLASSDGVPSDRDFFPEGASAVAEETEDPDPQEISKLRTERTEPQIRACVQAYKLQMTTQKHSVHEWSDVSLEFEGSRIERPHDGKVRNSVRVSCITCGSNVECY